MSQGFTGEYFTGISVAAHKATHVSGGTDAFASGDLLDATARVTIRKNTGADIGTRRRINLIEGSNVTLTIADDAGSEEVDVTIASTGGGGSHALLSATHTDTTSATVVRGDVITGQGASPTWSRLAIGSAGKILRSDGTDLVYSTFTIPDTMAVSTLLYASSANVLAALATAASSILVTSGASVPSWATDLPTAVTIGGAYIYRVSGTDVAVADGGTGLSSGTSGGILGFTAAGTIASSVALTANALVLGGGAGATPTPMASLGTTTTVLHGNAAGAPTFAAIALAADVSGTLPIANGGTGATTATAATAAWDALVGDAGSGGTKGLAPAPAAGDAAAGKYLKADATWAVPAGGSMDINGLTAADPSLTDESPVYVTGLGNRKITVQEIGGFLAIGVSEFRLTLTSATPVTTADVTAAGSIYLTPYIGNRIRIYDGTRWNEYQTSEMVLGLTLTSGNNYDVFVYDSGGTPTLELSAAWTNDMTRADALTTQDGVYVKSGATTRLWVGTIRASAANATEDSAAKRFVWNVYNRAPRKLKRVESTDSWTYSTNTWRSWNNSTTNRVEFVCGAAEAHVRLIFTARGFNNTAATNQGAIGIDLDGTASGADSDTYAAMGSGVEAIPGTAVYDGYPGLGYHFLQLMEIAGGGGTSTWIGDGGVTWIQSGAVGAMLG